MRMWHIFLFFGMVVLSANAVNAGNLSANPWLRKNSADKTAVQVRQEKHRRQYRSPQSEETNANPWGRNDATSSTVASGSQLKQELKSAAENSQKSLQNLSERAHRLAAFSSITFQNEEQEKEQPGLIEELSELMNNKQQNNTHTPQPSFNYGNTSSFGGFKKYSINSQQPSLGTQASDAYHQTTDKVKRNIKSKYNTIQREIAPYTNSARNAMHYLEKNSGASMEQIQKIMH